MVAQSRDVSESYIRFGNAGEKKEKKQLNWYN